MRRLQRPIAAITATTLALSACGGSQNGSIEAEQPPQLEQLPAVADYIPAAPDTQPPIQSEEPSTAEQTAAASAPEQELQPEMQLDGLLGFEIAIAQVCDSACGGALPSDLQPPKMGSAAVEDPAERINNATEVYHGPAPIKGEADPGPGEVEPTDDPGDDNKPPAVTHISGPAQVGGVDVDVDMGGDFTIDGPVTVGSDEDTIILFKSVDTAAGDGSYTEITDSNGETTRVADPKQPIDAPDEETSFDVQDDTNETIFILGKVEDTIDQGATVTITSENGDTFTHVDGARVIGDAASAPESSDIGSD